MIMRACVSVFVVFAIGVAVAFQCSLSMLTLRVRSYYLLGLVRCAAAQGRERARARGPG